MEAKHTKANNKLLAAEAELHAVMTEVNHKKQELHVVCYVLLLLLLLLESWPKSGCGKLGVVRDSPFDSPLIWAQLS